MTLYEFMLTHQDIYELTVWDKDYDMEIYFYPDCINSSVKWDKAMCEIAKKLTVIDESKDECITVNLSEVVERSLNGELRNLFCYNDIDCIMMEMGGIFAGYATEKWMVDFARSLK